MKYSEIAHDSHRQHKLKLEYSKEPFKCNGCEEAGIGSRYQCSICDFDLHKHCAIPSTPIKHRFRKKCSFRFFTRPPGDKPRCCDACQRDVTGFVYHCECGFDLHPCCAKLPMVLEEGEVKLSLCKNVSSSCKKCGGKGEGWSYRSTCKNKKYNLHVACVKDMLEENWLEEFLGRGNSTKLENRIPSLKICLQTPHKKSKGKVQKFFEMAGLAVQFMIAAVLGDPTALIPKVIGSLMSKG